MKRLRVPRLGGVSILLACLAAPVLANGPAQAEPEVQRSAEKPSAEDLFDDLRPPAYTSPLDGYQGYRADEPLRDWREANDEMGRLGGHLGHMAPPAGKGRAQP